MKFTIITPTFNNASTILRSIESLHSQTESNFEHIVVDNMSQDGTVEICKEFSSKINIIQEKDSGIYDAINKGINISTGDVIGVLHANDLYNYDHVLFDVSKYFEQSKRDIVFGNVSYFKENDSRKTIRYFSSKNFKKYKLKFGFMPPHTATFIKKKIFTNYGCYNTSYQIASDYELFVRTLLINDVNFFQINKTLVKMSLGGLSTSGLYSWIQSTKEIKNIFKEHNIKTNLFFLLLRFPIKFLEFFKREK